MFKFLEKTEAKIKAEVATLLASAKSSLEYDAEEILKIADKLDARTIAAFEELHAAIEAEEAKLAPPPAAEALAPVEAPPDESAQEAKGDAAI